jgi:peptidoglycan/LPS O-acetylase OafA/YrhL
VSDARSDVVPDAVAPPGRHPRFPLVDGLRAIAVLSVLGVHAATAGGAISSSLSGRVLAHLNIGVTIFFVISGFLLYRPFIAHRAGGAGAPAVPGYLKRRFLRIYPAYWLVLTVLVVVPGLTGVIDGNWWPMYALVHTLPLYDGRGCLDAPSTCGLAQTWSLVVELTFYAALPLHVAAMARLTRRLRVTAWMWAELGALVVLSTASLVLQFAIFDPVPKWLGGSLLSYLLWFSLGMGLAVASVALDSDGRRPRVLGAIARRPEVPWAAALALYALLCAWMPATPLLLARSDVLITHVAFGVIAALLLVPAVLGDRRRGLPHRVLAHPVAAWLGLVSYGIFLWHFVITQQLGPGGAGAPFLVVLLGTLAISTACAAVSYYVVEEPVLRLKHRRLRDVVARRRAA